MTNDEKSIMENAYKTPADPQLKGSGNLNEKVAENTRFRSEVSRRNGHVAGEELDKVIDNMSDDEVISILESGDSYGIDYAQYIKENPSERKQMIRNIKLAWEKVGVFAGTAAGLYNTVIQGHPALKQQQGGDYKPPFEEYYKTVPQYKNDTTHDE